MATDTILLFFRRVMFWSVFQEHARQLRVRVRSGLPTDGGRRQLHADIQ